MQKSRGILLALCVVAYFIMAASLAACASIVGPTMIRPQEEKSVVRVITAEDERQIECLAENVYHEARGESVRGQEAVAHVTMNRVNSGEFASNVCDVVWQGGATRRGCQFSWTCDGLSDRIRDQDLYAAILERMRAFYVNPPVDFTNGAEYYHANYVRPRWSRAFVQTAQIGAHIFYRG